MKLTLMKNGWAVVPANELVQKLMKTDVDYPPRMLQIETDAGPITLTQYQRFQSVRKALAKDGFNLSLPSGN